MRRSSLRKRKATTTTTRAIKASPSTAADAHTTTTNKSLTATPLLNERKVRFEALISYLPIRPIVDMIETYLPKWALMLYGGDGRTIDFCQIQVGGAGQVTWAHGCCVARMSHGVKMSAVADSYFTQWHAMAPDQLVGWWDGDGDIHAIFQLQPRVDLAGLFEGPYHLRPTKTKEADEERRLCVWMGDVSGSVSFEPPEPATQRPSRLLVHEIGTDTAKIHVLGSSVYSSSSSSSSTTCKINRQASWNDPHFHCDTTTATTTTVREKTPREASWNDPHFHCDTTTATTTTVRKKTPDDDDGLSILECMKPPPGMWRLHRFSSDLLQWMAMTSPTTQRQSQWANEGLLDVIHIRDRVFVIDRLYQSDQTTSNVGRASVWKKPDMIRELTLVEIQPDGSVRPLDRPQEVPWSDREYLDDLMMTSVHLVRVPFIAVKQYFVLKRTNGWTTFSMPWPACNRLQREYVVLWKSAGILKKHVPPQQPHLTTAAVAPTAAGASSTAAAPVTIAVHAAKQQQQHRPPQVPVVAGGYTLFRWEQERAIAVKMTADDDNKRESNKSKMDVKTRGAAVTAAWGRLSAQDQQDYQRRYEERQRQQKKPQPKPDQPSQPPPPIAPSTSSRREKLPAKRYDRWHVQWTDNTNDNAVNNHGDPASMPPLTQREAIRSSIGISSSSSSTNVAASVDRANTVDSTSRLKKHREYVVDCVGTYGSIPQIHSIHVVPDVWNHMLVLIQKPKNPYMSVHHWNVATGQLRYSSWLVIRRSMIDQLGVSVYPFSY